MAQPALPNKKKGPEHSPGLRKPEQTEGSLPPPPPGQDGSNVFSVSTELPQICNVLEKYIADKQKKKGEGGHLEVFLPNGNFLEVSSFRSNFWKISWLIQIREQT